MFSQNADRRAEIPEESKGVGEVEKNGASYDILYVVDQPPSPHSQSDTRMNITIQSTTSDSTKAPPLAPVHVCKQSVQRDVAAVQQLETATTRNMFGEVNLANCIEKYTCKSMFNEDEELVAFIVMRDHPNSLALTNGSCSWAHWARYCYGLEGVSSWNTLFIWYLVWDPRYKNLHIDFLKSFYKNNVKLDQIILLLPPYVTTPQELTKQFTAVFPRGAAVTRGSGDGPIALLNLRISIVNKLVLRKACEEDNIDVQPLLFCQFDILKEIFGNFKLGKVIDLKDKNKSVIVAEKLEKMGGVTVGVISLTSVVDYNNLASSFKMPLLDFKAETAKSETSKPTVKNSGWIVGQSSEDDLQSIMPGMLVDYSNEDSTSSEDSSEASSKKQSIAIDDFESEFTIVDPAVEYLLSMNRYMVAPSNSTTGSISYDSSTFLSKPGLASLAIPSEIAPSERVTIKEVTYCGPENGFRISLFALHPDLDHRYAYDILEATFECFPDKYYCLLSLPTFYQASPLLQHSVRITPRLTHDFPHELYIIHRSSMFCEFNIRGVSVADYDAVSEILDNTSQGRRLKKDLVSLIFGESADSLGYLLEREGVIVGIAIVAEQFSLPQLQPHYRLEDILTLNQHGRQRHGLLKHVVLATIHQRAGPFFLRQIMHRCGVDTLSFCLQPNDQYTKMDVLAELCPVRPRKRIQYEVSALEGFVPEECVLNQNHEFALYLASERTLSIPKLELNYRIVVVGASDTAISFLENLVFTSSTRYIHYTNITLVTTDLLPLDLMPHAAADMMNPHSGLYSKNYLSRLGLMTYVNIFYGTMTSIRRKEKVIFLSDGYCLRYDYLFLFTGTQFRLQMLPVGCGSDSTACQKNESIRLIFNKLSKDIRGNVFLINSTKDALQSLINLKKIVLNKKSGGKILVYGSCINIFTCVEALTSFGVPGHRIVLIKTPQTCSYRTLEINTAIEQAVLQALDHAGVTVHHGYTLVNWTTNITSVNKVLFHSEINVPMILECMALFLYAEKTTRKETYLAMIDSGIVYNNGIIINSQFRTNDEFIFAAGPGTRYSSRYRETQADHEVYSSLEVGAQASHIFRRLVEPQLPDEEGPPPDTLPRMSQPVTLVAQLPGGWNYVRISVPGKPLPLECQMHGQGDSGPVLVTGGSVPINPDGPGYFQLSLSLYLTVREIVCFSKKAIPYHNLECLIGKHEQLLNRLFDRFTTNQIPDLFAFFAQPWAYALYTTDFDSLLSQCSDMFAGDDILNRYLKEAFNNCRGSLVERRGTMSLEGEDSLTRQYQDSVLPRYVEHLTLHYVRERALQLPMYLQGPGAVRAPFSPLNRPDLLRPTTIDSPLIDHFNSYIRILLRQLSSSSDNLRFSSIETDDVNVVTQSGYPVD